MSLTKGNLFLDNDMFLGEVMDFEAEELSGLVERFEGDLILKRLMTSDTLTMLSLSFYMTAGELAIDNGLFIFIIYFEL